MVRNGWGDDNFGFEDIEVTDRHFLVIYGHCCGSGIEFAIANVYAPQSISDKRKLWLDLSNLIKSRDVMWILMGDFNAVRKRDERLNSIFCPYTAQDFNIFITGEGLFDLKMGGFEYTYFQQAGAKLSKLDRILVCHKFLINFPQASCTSLPREQSDHCPIMLELNSKDFGPVPFKMFNSWLLRTGFNEVVIKASSDFKGYGVADSFLLNKLKFIKNRIRSWKAVNLSQEQVEIETIKNRMVDLDKKVERNDLNGSEKAEWAKISNRLTELEKLVTLDIKQKARIKWLINGDENSRFFHGFVKNRIRKNHMNGLMINGVWSNQPDEMKAEIFRFFFLQSLKKNGRSDQISGVQNSSPSQQLAKTFWKVISRLMR
ncbi:uncharacterized protein LOC111917117 [Lactuca sativa]|uniref:uncharacterized protein LOC111917117 n=1 Tax=Lactuca sativa TaxID=4236 RepID=UPI000CD8F2C3|nr:uncharacterized protein LOC111917117 [Lactuca sativa]